jgi:hypothetical protein
LKNRKSDARKGAYEGMSCSRFSVFSLSLRVRDQWTVFGFAVR